MIQIKVLGKGLEQLLHVLSCLSWCLSVMAEMLLSSELKCLIVGHFSLFLQIGKVANQVNNDILTGMIADFSQPLSFYIIETLPASDIEDKENATRALVETASDRSETLLASSVPNLQLHVCFLFNDHSEISKLNTNGHSMLLCEFLIGEAL